MKRTPLDRPDPDSLGSISFGIEHGTVAPIVYDYTINRERLFEAARRYALVKEAAEKLAARGGKE